MTEQEMKQNMLGKDWLVFDCNADSCCMPAQGAGMAHLDSTAMLGLGAPVGFGVGQETGHFVCLGIATGPLGSAEIGLQLRLLGQ